MAQTFSLNWLQSDLRKAIDERDVDHERIASVLEVAFHYHSGQFRENGQNKKKIPYITHPVGVAKISVEEYSNVSLQHTLTDLVCAALMHDLLEDTSIETSEIEQLANSQVLNLVSALSKPTSTAFENRGDRNRAFIKRIEDGGSSAKFLKICDALHNLSRPASMPPSLLKKTIGKAKRDYLPLSYDPNFSSLLRERLEDAIGIAEAHSQAVNVTKSYHSSSDNFLAYCIERSAGKILELHDIQEILLELEGLSLAFSGSVAEFTTNFLVDFIETPTQKNLMTLRQTVNDKGVIVLSGRPFAAPKVKNLNFQEIRCLPLSSTLGPLSELDWIFLGVDQAKAKSWLTQPFLKAVLSILSERYKEQQTKVLSDYTDWITTVGVDLDPRVAASLSLSREAIVDIAEAMRAAVVELGAIMPAIGLMLEGKGQDYLSLERSSRIKSASSISKKFVRLAITSIYEIEDLIGIRIVMLNQSSASRFARDLKREILQAESIWTKGIRVVPDSLDLRTIETVHGYRARHLLFRTTSAYLDEQTISCEIQIRTAFEDLWARIAHKSDYKSEVKLNRPSKAKLKKLAEVCKNADDIVDDI